LIILLHKPWGTLCQFSGGEEGKRTLADHVPVPGVYPAGRLDQDSEGLLVLTDEPWFAHRLTHPRHGHLKRYQAQVEGPVAEAAIRQFADGVVLDGTPTRSAILTVPDPQPAWHPREKPIRFRLNVPTAWVEVGLREGRNRQVRRMLAAVGLPCLRLIRVEVAGLVLAGLKPGALRRLEGHEVRALKARLET
jgi:23S rRNA pseudouridine2457 synthase